jgi:hypothetical protein
LCGCRHPGLRIRGQAFSPATGKSEVLLSTMQSELLRAQEELGKLDQAPYFMSYSVARPESCTETTGTN